MKKIRAVLHAHSLWSYDGHWPLRRIAQIYGAFGVDVVMMSEHDAGFDPARFGEYRDECAAASTGKCTLIPGIEYSSPDNDIHILTWGLSEFLAEYRPVAETLRAVKAQGGVAVFAHPVRREAWKQFDPEWVPLLCGIELWNRKSDGIVWGQEAWRLIRQTGLPATVGQDFHRLRQLYPLTMMINVEKETNLEAALVQALNTGEAKPEVFRRPLLGNDGALRGGVHKRLEWLRQKILVRTA